VALDGVGQPVQCIVERSLDQQCLRFLQTMPDNIHARLGSRLPDCADATNLARSGLIVDGQVGFASMSEEPLLAALAHVED
jgi:hypothetical protein